MSALSIAVRGIAAQNRALAAALTAPRRSRCVVTGDSIVAGDHVVNSGGNQYWGASWANQALWRSGRLRGIANTAASGRTSTQQLALWQSGVLASNPDLVLLMIGTNDLVSGMSTAQIATLMTNIEQMVLQSIAAGVLVVLCTPPAKDAAKPETRRVIPYFYRLAEAYDLPLIDMFQLTVSPSGGGWKAGWSDDGTHPNAVGSAAMAAYAGPILASLASWQYKPYLAAYSETSAGQPANLIRNGSFAQQTTPGVPDGWSIGGAGGSYTYDVTQNAAAPCTGSRSGEVSLVLANGPLRWHQRWTKEMFDYGFGAIAFVVAAPVMLAIAIAIRAEDGGPVFFRQDRIGLGNRPFQIWKFRTMRIQMSDRLGAVSTSRSDQRVTRVGRLLRRTSLDELPQLLNVLAGQMSIVGPRPHAPASRAEEQLFWDIDQRYWHRHSIKPGITGLAQVRGLRGATERQMDLEQRLYADLEYVAKWSLLTDLRIIGRTFRVLLHRNAY